MSGVVTRDSKGDFFVWGVRSPVSFLNSDQSYSPVVIAQYLREEDELVVQVGWNLDPFNRRNWHDFYGDNWPRKSSARPPP